MDFFGISDTIGKNFFALFRTHGNNGIAKLCQKSLYCKKNLEPFMVPKYVEFREKLPKNNSGKIDKKRLA